MSELFTESPLSPMRQMIADRMVAAKTTIPHYRVSMDINMDSVIRLRKRLNAESVAGTKLSLNDFIIKAAAQSLIQVPEINVQLVEGKVRQFHSAHISVVIATDGGIVTPVIREAEQQSVYAISASVSAFAERANKKRLKMHEFEGGTFTISNLGMFGVCEFDAIINAPQGAIMAVAGIEEKYWVNNGKNSIANVMRVTLSLDHRLIDGVQGAKYLQFFKKQIENPENIVELFGGDEQ